MALVSQTTIKRDVQGNVVRAFGTVRAAAVLTGSYVASSEMDISRFRELAVFFTVTKASLTSLEYLVEQSVDEGVSWKRIGAESVTLSTITDGRPNYSETLAGNDEWYKAFRAIGAWVRVQVRGVGTAAGSSCKIEIVGVG
jgi:hypothetical protein